VEQVSFAEAYSSVNEKRIVGFARRFADRDAACVRKTIARTYDEIVKRVIGMQLERNDGFGRGKRVIVADKSYGHKMVRDLLRSKSKTFAANILKKARTLTVGTFDFELSAAKIFIS
jgi:hypothetical protein